MNTFYNHVPSAQIQRSAGIAATLVAMAALAACTSTGSGFRTTGSSLPVETGTTAGGEILDSRAHESAERLYVSGAVEKAFGRHIPYGAHVDVQLVDKAGRVVAEKQDDIDSSSPRSAGSRSGRHRFAVSFPIEEARQSAKVVVRYHLDDHNT